MSERPVTLREPGGPQAGLLCPVCRVDLVMADKQGVEIDYCPKCRGIWLDRGEIDKIIERSLDQVGARGGPRAAPYPEPAPPPAYPPQGYGQPQGWSGGGHGHGHGGGHHDGGGHGGGHHGSSGGYGKHGRRSWLRDLLD